MKRRALTQSVLLGIREAIGLYGCELDVAGENYEDLKERQERLAAVWKWVSYAENKLDERALKRTGVRI